MATIQEALEAFRYYIENGGYYEKASSSYCGSRAVENFSKNKGGANYTWMGKVCGLNPGEWCAMLVSTAVYEACGNDAAAARRMLWGRWPHYNCGTLADDARAAGLFHWSWYALNRMGKTGAAYVPQPGDVVVYTNAWNTRDHTGMVYAADGKYVYVYEGNSANMARARSYALTSAYIYGYSTLAAEAGSESGVALFQRRLGVTPDGVYGPATKAAAVKAHQAYLNRAHGSALDEDGAWGPQTYYATRQLQYGDKNDDVAIWQGLLYGRGLDPVGIDGDFGGNTQKATEAFQLQAGLLANGLADPYTWAVAFGAGRPTHSTLRRGSRGEEVRYLQLLLTKHGHSIATDGGYGEETESAVTAFQTEKGLEADGVCGPLTWAALE